MMLIVLQGVLLLVLAASLPFVALIAVVSYTVAFLWVREILRAWGVRGLGWWILSPWPIREDLTILQRCWTTTLWRLGLIR
jgi:hypothetical protein